GTDSRDAMLCGKRRLPAAPLASVGAGSLMGLGVWERMARMIRLRVGCDHRVSRVPALPRRSLRCRPSLWLAAASMVLGAICALVAGSLIQYHAARLLHSPAGTAPIAQLDRALPSGGKGQRFESSWARHFPHSVSCCQVPNSTQTGSLPVALLFCLAKDAVLASSCFKDEFL